MGRGYWIIAAYEAEYDGLCTLFHFFLRYRQSRTVYSCFARTPLVTVALQGQHSFWPLYFNMDGRLAVIFSLSFPDTVYLGNLERVMGFLSRDWK
jgi:hypothetical protein